MPDHTTEIFEPSSDVFGSDRDDRSVRVMEWTRDPNTTDTWVETDYVFVVRVGDEPAHVAHEVHRTGLFTRQQWLEVLTSAGFAAQRMVEITDEDRLPRDVFVGVRTA